MEKGHGAIEGFADGYPGTPEAVSITVVLKLILDVAKLEREVLGELACMVQAENQFKLLGAV